MPSLTDEQRQLTMAWKEQGRSMGWMSKQLGITAYFLRKLGVTTYCTRCKKIVFSDEVRADIQDMIDKGYSLHEAGAKYGVSRRLLHTKGFRSLSRKGKRLSQAEVEQAQALFKRGMLKKEICAILNRSPDVLGKYGIKVYQYSQPLTQEVIDEMHDMAYAGYSRADIMEELGVSRVTQRKHGVRTLMSLKYEKGRGGYLFKVPPPPPPWLKKERLGEN